MRRRRIGIGLIIAIVVGFGIAVMLKTSSTRFNDAMDVNLNKLTKIVAYYSDGVYISQKTITNQEKMQELVDYFSGFKYKKLKKQDTSAVPDRLFLFYFYQGRELNIVIASEDESVVIHEQEYNIVKNKFDLKYFDYFIKSAN